MNPQNKELRTFGYGLGLLIPFILSSPILKLYINFYIFVGLFILLLIVINYVDRARPIYYLALGIPGIILRILNKDLLACTMDRQARSYWIKKESKPFKKEDYTRQF